jgi:hypothetical protein
MQDNAIVALIKQKRAEQTYFEQICNLCKSVKLHVWDWYFNPKEYERFVIAQKYLQVYEQLYESWRIEQDRIAATREGYCFK